MPTELTADYRDEDLDKFSTQEAQLDAMLSALRQANQLDEANSREIRQLQAKLR